MIERRPQHLVLCEGYDDRALLSGIFSFLGRSSMSRVPGEGVPTDDWGDDFREGAYGFKRVGSPCIRLESKEGVSKFGKRARFALEGVETRPLESLTLVRDDDTEADAEPLDLSVWLRGILQRDVRRVPGEQFTFDAAGVRVYAVAWRSSAAPAPGVPTKQTLERLICTALACLDHERAASVERWLHDTPACESMSPKAYAGSYIAKWYGEVRAERFYQQLMELEPTRNALKSQLDDVWYVFERLAG